MMMMVMMVMMMIVMMMMYTGAPRRAFQLSVVYEVERRSMYNAPLTAAIRPMRDLRASRDEITGHNTGISLLLSTSAWVLLSPR